MIIFDNYFAGYDEWYKTSLGQFIDHVESDVIFSFLSCRVGSRILDIGCGTGNYCEKLVNKGYLVDGIDISKQMLNIAQTKQLQGVTLYEMNAESLYFDDNTFDAIVSVTAFEFIHDVKKMLAESLRVLKPNGKLIIGTIQKESEWFKLYQSKAFQDSPYSYANFYTEEELIQLLPQSYLFSTKQCLFVPPSLAENEYTQANELYYAQQGYLGGFVCVVFQKISSQ